MGFLGRLFGRKEPEPPPEQAVIVHFDYGSTDLAALHAVEDELEQAIAEAGAGELDGHEIAIHGSDGRFYLYGPDADALLTAVRPVLARAACLENLKATLRHGADDSARTAEIALPPQP